jgi:hypothetical protein
MKEFGLEMHAFLVGLIQDVSVLLKFRELHLIL